MEITTIIPVSNDRAAGMLTQIAKHFAITLEKDCKQERIKLPDAIADAGMMHAYSPSEGIDALIIDGKFHNNTELLLHGGFPSPLTFITQAKGTSEVITERRQFKLNPLQCSIYAGFTEDTHSYHFPKGEQVTCMITMIHKKRFFKDIDCDVLDLPSDLLSTIIDMTRRKESFLFQNIYHLPAIDTLKDIIAQDQIGLLNSTFATAKIFENLYLQLRHYKEVVADDSRREKLKEENQLAKIQNAEQILTARLIDPPTIPELARMVGTNQQYLKSGFRRAFGTTINQYVTDCRLEQAGILIRGGKMSIAEVAATVGYNSSGYFTRRFKEKYGVAPKNFNRDKVGLQ